MHGIEMAALTRILAARCLPIISARLWQAPLRQRQPLRHHQVEVLAVAAAVVVVAAAGKWGCVINESDSATGITGFGRSGW